MSALTDPGESILFSLRSLYGQYGYTHYKMNKFEEYDLYAHNKDFLISDSVITFTDGNGKLLALKPDVTLSIVKNTADGVDSLKKLYYNENVYRVAKGSRNFKEIMQVGLECLGNIDRYCVYEVLDLASKSLDRVSGANILGVSHLGILSEVMDSIGVPEEKKADVIRFAGEKNLHELASVLSNCPIAEEGIALLRNLLYVSGKTADVLPEIRKMLNGKVSEETLGAFEDVLSALSENPKVQIDFSVVGDPHYYNGFIFKGFVEGIPNSVLSGGQYDHLMRKMGRRSGAIGFAVYLDTVEQYLRRPEAYDTDTVLLYDDTCTLGEISRAVGSLTSLGERVLTGTVVPPGIHYRKLLRMKNGKTEVVGDHA